MHLPLAIFWTMTSPTPSPNPSTRPPMNSMTTWEAKRATVPNALGFSGGGPFSWRPLMELFAHTAWRWYSHTVQRYIRPDLLLLQVPQGAPLEPLFIAGNSLSGWGWDGKLICVDSMAQQGCIWKLHALHLKVNPLADLPQTSHLGHEIPPVADKPPPISMHVCI